MGYTKHIIEFIKVRLEQTPNNTQIARDVKNKFQIERDLDTIRRYVARTREKHKIEAKKIPIKRLFFDIETSYYILKIRAWELRSRIKYFSYNDIEEEKVVLCICWKWQYDDKIYSLDWRMGEKNMLKTFVKIMGQADECIAHNSDHFDVPTLRTRCLYHGILMYPNYRSLDTLKKSRSGFKFASNSLDYLGKFVGIGGKTERRAMEQTKAVFEDGNEKALKEMVNYCKNDVVVLNDYYHIISPFIAHNNNFAVATGGEKWECPECTGKNVEMFRTYFTPMGIIKRDMKCNDCKKQYHVSNKTYMAMLEHLNNIARIREDNSKGIHIE